MGALDEYLENVRQRMLNRAREAGLIEHGQTVGMARELVVAEFLAATLPTCVDFLAGEVLDENDARSSQLDILIVPDYAARFRIAGDVAVVPTYGTVAAIEVKSAIHASDPGTAAAELTTSIAASRRLKKLSLRGFGGSLPWSTTHAVSQSDASLATIPYWLVAFEGPGKPEDLCAALERYAEGDADARQVLPNGICVLGAGYSLVLNNGYHFTGAGAELYIVSRACTGELFWCLMQYIQAWQWKRPATPLAEFLRTTPGALPASGGTRNGNGS